MGAFGMQPKALRLTRQPTFLITLDLKANLLEQLSEKTRQPSSHAGTRISLLWVCSCHACVGEAHAAERACGQLHPDLLKETELLPVAHVSLSL